MDFLASVAIVAVAAVVALVGGGIGIVGGLAERPGLRWGVLAVGMAILVLACVLAATRDDGQPVFVLGGRHGGSDELADSDAPLGGLWVRSMLFSFAGTMVLAWLLGIGAGSRKKSG